MVIASIEWRPYGGHLDAEKKGSNPDAGITIITAAIIISYCT